MKLVANSREMNLEIRQGIDDFHQSGKITWNPTLAHVYDDIIILAATILEHEFAHGVSFLKDPEAHRVRANEYDEQYDSKEERRVIIGAEQETAVKNGELKAGQVRRSHKEGRDIRTNDPTSTKESPPFPWPSFNDKFSKYMFPRSDRPFFEW